MNRRRVCAAPKWAGRARLIMAAPFSLFVSAAAIAQSPDGYFKGKTVLINIAGTPGGGIDIGARILARFLGKYLPGNPQVIAQNMPGAGGVRVLEYLHSQAPKDGTWLGAFASGPLLDPLIGPRRPNYGISDFLAIGAIDKDNGLCTTWHTNKVKTFDDAKTFEVTVAGTGAGSGTDTEPLVLNEVLGTKFRVITGYLGTQETALALERGEVDGRCSFGLASIKPSKPQWLKENRLNFLLQVGLEPEAEAKGAPMAMDLADTPDKKAMIRVMATPKVLGRPYLGPPGMHPERAAEMRKAFLAAFADQEMRAEFIKSSGGDEPKETRGEAMQKLLESIQATPVTVRDRLRALLNP